MAVRRRVVRCVVVIVNVCKGERVITATVMRPMRVTKREIDYDNCNNNGASMLSS